MNRELAVVKAITDIYPIKGKDRIVLVVIGGWSCIARKEEFKVGDLCVYFEDDSFLPVEPRYEFLKKTTMHQGKEGYRIKIMKMAGVISQGLALPLKMFPELGDVAVLQNVTEKLNVTKFDIDLVGNIYKQANNPQGNTKGMFPSGIPKTDEPRLQNLPHFFAVHKETEFEETLKLDGSSCTMYKKKRSLDFIQRLLCKLFRRVAKPHFGVCSRNLELKRQPGEGNNFWKAAELCNVEVDLPLGYAVQGEVIAPNIQGNYEKVDGVQYHIFRVIDLDNGLPLKPELAEAFVTEFLPKAKYIPVISRKVKLFQEVTTFEEAQARVSGPSIHPDVMSEGRVYKSVDGKVHFKVISNEYLLHKESK